MKIFYAVQATGNGHISRAMELAPQLQRFGSVDIFLSGDNSNLDLDLPIRYRSKGLSLYYNCSGGLNYRKMFAEWSPLRLRKEINDLPVDQYDLVINDFEYITSAACRKKQVPSIQLGHQASFQSERTPRPANKNRVGEWILKNYARATHYLGLHFDCYDDFILPPVIKQDILRAEPVDLGHITVYLPSWCEHVLEKVFAPFKDHQFQVFSKETRQIKKHGNLTFMPVSRQLFNQSLVSCHAIITGAGFETPAEALSLKKKLLCIPIRGQYEQLCNAAALEDLGTPCIDRIDADFPRVFERWLTTQQPVTVNYPDVIPQLTDKLFAIKDKQQEDRAWEICAPFEEPLATPLFPASR